MDRKDVDRRRRDLEGLIRLLTYGRAEAERLGLTAVAHHVDIALDEIEDADNDAAHPRRPPIGTARRKDSA